jgi:hypothetical protein
MQPENGKQERVTSVLDQMWQFRVTDANARHLLLYMRHTKTSKKIKINNSLMWI